MKQLTALLCFALLAFSNAQSPNPLVSEDCNATESQASLAIEEINKARNEGYVFTLLRVVDAQSQPEGAGNIFYLTFDVLETKCSVLSGKSAKECEIRSMHQTVFGQCKAVMYLNPPFRIVQLYRYNCTLSTVPPRLFSSMCPDCPLLASDLSPYVARAEEMIEHYNRESNNTNCFKLVKVEKASMQWVFAASYFVEFTIKEANCPRLESNASDCQFLPDGQAHVGFCMGSQYSSGPGESGISVSCDIYNPKPVPDHHHRHGHGKGHRHHHHHHPDGQNHTHSGESQHHHEKNHGEKHGHNHHPHNPDGQTHTHSGEIQHHHEENHGDKHEHVYTTGVPQTPPAQKPHYSSSEEDIHLKPIRPPKRGPEGSVQLIHLENENDVLPAPSIRDPCHPMVPPGAAAGPEPVSPGADGPGPVGPEPFNPFKHPKSQPFPLLPSESQECPGEPKHHIPRIIPLLPVPK